MDDLTYEAYRATSISQQENELEAEARFRVLVQSPLRASILRYLHARPGESCEVEALMQAFGRLRPDVDACLRELVDHGVVRLFGSSPARYSARRPSNWLTERLLHSFLDRRPAISTEDQSPAVQRFREMVGRDEKMMLVFEWVRTAAKSDIAVLILGPTGSGKELVARMIHELSPRHAAKLQAVNCAALPDTLFESEVFGYERGAFTGAQDRKPGRLELANRGTLLLDEIGDLSPMAQAKLLRVLEERRFERLGSNTPVDVDFRLISATNRPLDELVRQGEFREDLFYRINAFAIRLPSLRERQIDIPLLATRSLARHCRMSGGTSETKQFAKDALDRLVSYHWPGNIRELESTVSRAALSTKGRTIRAADIDFLQITEAPSDGQDAPLSSLRDAERVHIERVLNAVRWNKKEAARVLEISRGTLYRKIAEFSLEPHVASSASSSSSREDVA